MDTPSADEPTSGESNWTTGRKRPSNRLVGGIAMAAGIGDGWLVFDGGASAVQTIISATFMTVFVFVVLRLITGVRFRVRPESVDPSQRDASLPPRPGGWANPTTGQRALARLARLRGTPRTRHHR